MAFGTMLCKPWLSCARIRVHFGGQDQRQGAQKPRQVIVSQALMAWQVHKVKSIVIRHGTLAGGEFVPAVHRHAEVFEPVESVLGLID